MDTANYSVNAQILFGIKECIVEFGVTVKESIIRGYKAC